VLAIIVVLAAAIVMTMAVTERTREIGTLRALGTRPSGILRMFLAEGLALAVGGCLVGAAIALLVRSGLNASGIILRRRPARPWRADQRPPVSAGVRRRVPGDGSDDLDRLVLSGAARGAAPIVDALAHV
jgi:putative ABC transport system permease protein